MNESEAAPAAQDGAQAQARQVRFPGVQGRASFDGALLHPLRPARSDPLFPCAKEVHTDTLAEATTAETPGPVVGVERQWIDCAETDFSEQSATLGP